MPLQSSFFQFEIHTPSAMMKQNVGRTKGGENPGVETDDEVIAMTIKDYGPNLSSSRVARNP